MWEVTIVPDKQMTAEETSQWESKLLYNFENAGMILLKIREERGWEAKGFKSFKEYCGSLDEIMGTRKAYYLTDQAEVNNSLSQATGKTVRLPLTHALALKDLEPEQRLLAFNEATGGKEDAKPTAKVFERAARHVAPAAPPKKKRKAERDDSDGWSKEELKNDTELAMAFASLAILGADDIKAIQNGTIGLKRADIIFWAKLPRQKVLEIQDLVMGNRWSPADAIKFVGSMPDDNTSVEDLKNYCLSTKGKYYTATIDGFTITVKANRAALRR